MKLPMYQVDAFTSKLFAGNPAAVVLVEHWLPDQTLQAIATENNLSETAFVIPKGDVYGLRWFTPLVEVELCGHATMAAAFILFKHHDIKCNEMQFETRSGVLTVKRAGEILNMDFPSQKPKPVQRTEELVRALSARPSEVHASRDLVAVFGSQAEVAALKPDFDGIAALGAFAVIVTAPGDEVDFVSRFFAPGIGIPEDPVTGSAHATLTPFWSERLKRKKLHALQISKRGGEIHCEDRGSRVIIGGQAVEYLRGEITVE